MKKYTLVISFLMLIVNVNAQDSLSVYTGKYIFPDGSVVPEVDVVLTDGSLLMSSVAGTSSLVKMGIDSFTITEFSGVAVFKRDENMKINSVHIEAMGYILDGKKQENIFWNISMFISEKPKENFTLKR